MSKFDSLDDNVIRYMALIMDLPELLSFCKTSRNLIELYAKMTVFGLTV